MIDDYEIEEAGWKDFVGALATHQGPGIHLLLQVQVHPKSFAFAERLNLTAEEPRLIPWWEETEDRSDPVDLRNCAQRWVDARVRSLTTGQNACTFRVRIMEHTRPLWIGFLVARTNKAPEEPAPVAAPGQQSPCLDDWKTLQEAASGVFNMVNRGMDAVGRAHVTVDMHYQPIIEHLSTMNEQLSKQVQLLQDRLLKNQESHLHTVETVVAELIDYRVNADLAGMEFRVDTRRSAETQVVNEKLGAELIQQVGNLGEIYMASKFGFDPRLMPMMTWLQRHPEVVPVLSDPDLLEALEDNDARGALLGAMKDFANAVRMDRARKEAPKEAPKEASKDPRSEAPPTPSTPPV